jgi:NDP-sugar pyrophosphorylase family protein
MINVLLPAMGKSAFFKDSYFPKPLTEINGMTMLDMVIENYKNLNPKNYIFVFSEEDCLKFHLDDSAKILTPASRIIKLAHQTAGALCTCLMAVEYINDDIPLLIANSDQIIEVDYQSVIGHFEEMEADAGVITFPNVHPRWSYARKRENVVVEVAEKRPLSKDAIAGFYYFKRGSDFVQAAKNALLKQNNLDGHYYISASINELILLGKKVGYYDIAKEQYKSFYSPAKIKEYEESLK